MDWFAHPGSFACLRLKPDQLARLVGQRSRGDAEGLRVIKQNCQLSTVGKIVVEFSENGTQTSNAARSGVVS